jgi:hypothetical protein
MASRVKAFGTSTVVALGLTLVTAALADGMPPDGRPRYGEELALLAPGRPPDVWGFGPIPPVLVVPPLMGAEPLHDTGPAFVSASLPPGMSALPVRPAPPTRILMAHPPDILPPPNLVAELPPRPLPPSELVRLETPIVIVSPTQPPLPPPVHNPGPGGQVSPN